MNRLWMLCVAFGMITFLVGCGGDTREGLVTDTIQRMGIATSEIGLITEAVNKAVDDVKNKKTKQLDLTEAKKLAGKLKETGAKIVEIKQRIDMVRSQITDSERQQYAESQQEALNTAFRKLLEAKTAYHTAMTAAEAYDKAKVEELRKIVIDAESPFEAQARQ